MSKPNHCDHCGSAGSIEFGMCQVCLKDYSRDETYFGGRSKIDLGYYPRSNNVQPLGRTHISRTTSVGFLSSRKPL